MEKSKLKISEISAGNWMSINGKSVEIVAVSELNGSVVYFEEEVEDMVEVSIDAVKPIPLTHEIMKTYGFVADRTFPKYITYTHHVFKEKDFERNGCKYNTDYCVSVDMAYDSDNVLEVSIRSHCREGIFSIKQTKTNEPYFLHELQHAMRDCRVEERRVLL